MDDLDDNLLDEVCRTFNLNMVETRNDIQNNKHNKHTSCYFILKKKYEREKFMNHLSIKVLTDINQTPQTQDESPEFISEIRDNQNYYKKHPD